MGMHFGYRKIQTEMGSLIICLSIFLLVSTTKYVRHLIVLTDFGTRNQNTQRTEQIAIHKRMAPCARWIRCSKGF